MVAGNRDRSIPTATVNSREEQQRTQAIDDLKSDASNQGQRVKELETGFKALRDENRRLHDRINQLEDTDHAVESLRQEIKILKKERSRKQNILSDPTSGLNGDQRADIANGRRKKRKTDRRQHENVGTAAEERHVLLKGPRNRIREIMRLVIDWRWEEYDDTSDIPMDRASVWSRVSDDLQDESKIIPDLNTKYLHPENTPYSQKFYRQCEIESSKPHNASIKSTLQDVTLLDQAAGTYRYQLKKNFNRAISGQTYDERNRVSRQRNRKTGLRDVRVDKIPRQMVNEGWTEDALLSVRSFEFHWDIETDKECDISTPKKMIAIRPPWSSSMVSLSMCTTKRLAVV